MKATISSKQKTMVKVFAGLFMASLVQVFFMESAKAKTLLDSPVDSCRLSRHYGKAVSPISKRKVNVIGTSLATPSGTDVKATGDGVIVKIGDGGQWCGNTVEIEHPNKTKTKLCSLRADGFPQGLKVGSKVSKGEKIALSGNTGMVTGSLVLLMTYKKDKKGEWKLADPARNFNRLCGLSRADLLKKKKGGNLPPLNPQDLETEPYPDDEEDYERPERDEHRAERLGPDANRSGEDPNQDILDSNRGRF
jgi:murein DD-endopeptidase MepM/ murein hydrolase activator NlpD